MTKFEQIPNFTELRDGKAGYDTRFAIDTEHPLYRDPLVDPRELGFTDASSYYSKPNSMTGEVLPGVPDAPLVRLDVAKRLQHAEHLLGTNPDVRDAFGTPLHLRIDDALRPYEVQKFAYNVAWPAVIRKVNPGITDEQLAVELPKYVAKPSGTLTPTPHLTGGAVDVALVEHETGKVIDRGHKGGAIKGTAFPDFHEGYHLDGESDIPADSVYEYENPEARRKIILGRRMLYWAMTSAGLVVNPNEIWHYGKGDPLSEYVSGSNRPYYGVAELPDWYKDQMRV